MLGRPAAIEEIFCVLTKIQEGGFGRDVIGYDSLSLGGHIRSFALENDIENLNKKNMLEFSGGQCELVNHDKAKRYISELTFEEQMGIKEVLKKGLVFTAVKQPKASAKAKGFVEGKSFYTSGYEGDSIDSFLNRLLNNQVQTIIDVRKNPVSRKFGFSKKALQKCAAAVDIKYVHFPQLGIESSARKELKTKNDYDELFKQYKKHVLGSTDDCQEELSRIISESVSVLVCYEADIDFCHRKHLAEQLMKKFGLTSLNI